MAASAHKEEELSITQLTRLPVAELRDRLKKRGLDTTGRKAELVARLATGGEEEEDATSEKSEGSRKRPEGPPLAGNKVFFLCVLLKFYSLTSRSCAT